MNKIIPVFFLCQLSSTSTQFVRSSTELNPINSCDHNPPEHFFLLGKSIAILK